MVNKPLDKGVKPRGEIEEEDDDFFLDGREADIFSEDLLFCCCSLSSPGP